jgi:hypothetical protein
MLAMSPVPTGVLLLSARRKGVCRVCGAPITLWVSPEYPQEFDKPLMRDFRCPISGVRVCMNLGEEWAHYDCLFYQPEK